VNYSVYYFNAYQLDYDYDVLNHEACSRVCDEWIILVQWSSFSIVIHLKMAETCCVESESIRKKEQQFVALLADCVALVLDVTKTKKQ
jgi:hypothetical protein